MNVGPIDNRGVNQTDAPAEQDFDESTGNHAVDEAVAAFQAALAQFAIHSTPAIVAEVARGALEVDNALRTSNLSPDQKEVILTNLKTSILDSGLPNLGSPTVASEADDLFSHLLPPALLNFPSIAALFDESNTESPLLAAAGRIDTALSALEDAKRKLEDDPNNEDLKDQVQGSVEQYLNELLKLRTLIIEYVPADGEDNLAGITGLKAALDEIALLSGS